MDLTQYIVKTNLENTDYKLKYKNKKFMTLDSVYLPSKKEAEKLPKEVLVAEPTDYAIATGLKRIGFKWPAILRSSSSDLSRCDISLNDLTDEVISKSFKYAGLRPAMNLDSSKIESEIKNFPIYSIFGRPYHTIEFGEYPKSFVGEKLNNKLNNLLKTNSIQPTGKEYGVLEEMPLISKMVGTLNKEYVFNGEKFVKVEAKINEVDEKFINDEHVINYAGRDIWFRVEPIQWIITNWDDLSKQINPNGSGKSKCINLISKDIISTGVSFSNNPLLSDNSFWANSPIRAYLNGINTNHIYLKSGIMPLPGGGNYPYEKSFLAQAFDIQPIKTYNSTINNNTVNNNRVDNRKINNKQETLEDKEQENQKTLETEVKEPIVKKSRLEKLNPDKTLDSRRRKMTDTEIIKSWIDAGQSVLLRGPSGIGKTERIKKLYPDLIYIKLTNNMFPEKVVGSVNLQTGESIPPDFAKQAILSCANEQEKKLITENIQNLYDLADTIYERSKTAKGKTVIMLDELLNVKPAVQSLVYTLVLNKIVETGKGLKLPANTVVVATGNQKKYSNVAEDLAEPLEKRFDHILDMEPKVGEWIYEYAIPNKIHPSVVGYLFNKYQQNRKNESLSKIGYFYEEPEIGEKHLDKNGCRGRTNDPRGWTSISNTLYAFEEDLQKGKFIGKNVEDLLKVTINSKLREEWAEEFVDFYNHPTLTVEEVANKKYSQVDLPANINEKFACLAGLLSADENQVGACREFIRKYCDPEYLSVYDLYWAGNDEKRIEKLVEIQEMEVLKNEGGIELWLKN